MNDELQARLTASKLRERRYGRIGAAGIIVSGGGIGACITYAALMLGDWWLAIALSAVVIVRIGTELSSFKASSERAYQHMEMVLAFDRSERRE